MSTLEAPAHLLALYEQMYTIRAFEEQVMELLRIGEITGSTHLCIGQEAVPVGASAVLQASDAVIATYRGHGWAIARGVPLAALFAELMGRASVLCDGRGGSAYFMAPDHGFLGENSIVGAGVPMALGAALARRFQRRDAIGLVSIGDGAMNQGAVHESLNMAAVLAVPLVVVVENNGYVEMTPSQALTAKPAHVRAAAAYGIESVLVDGNDPDAVGAAVERARATAIGSQRPFLIEAETHRLVGHYSGDLQAYRPPGELDAARLREPLVRLAATISDDEATDAVRARVARLLAEELDVARRVPPANPERALVGLYAGPER
ncbi:MAG: acetoin dehydrogenase alpha subunit [Acidimicrobiaceae bacterium]|nr:acetoin dehydrogenase alpha subunit [Acidimicrobiaceae bacterium]